jgi:hypothetical protein
MYDALQSHGVRVESHVYPKRGHADTIASFSLAARLRTPALHETLTFLRSVTAETPRKLGRNDRVADQVKRHQYGRDPIGSGEGG